jgi:hypothetical protein
VRKFFAYLSKRDPNEGPQDREHQGPSFEGLWLVAGARFVRRYHRPRIREPTKIGQD